MLTTAEQPLMYQQHEQLNHELRVRTDTTTWLAEVLNGNMRTSFEFSFDGQEFYGEDGGALTSVFDDAVLEAEIIVQQNPNMYFELRRRLIERDELDDMKAMALGELHTDDGKPVNTIVVVSDFPPELMGAQEDVGGYNAKRKQTMLRVITLEDDGTIRVTTQSLDGSNRQALEAIYAGLGKQPKEGELLSQRVHLSESARRQPEVINSLTAVHDDSLKVQYGGEWYAGRRPADYRNTYEFACKQYDLIEWFTREKCANPVGAERLRFKLAATATARYERLIRENAKPEPIPGMVPPQALVSVDRIAAQQPLMMELERESARAARQGKTFSGCGASAKAEETGSSSVEAQLSELGYGNKVEFNADGDCEFRSKKCPECGTKDVWTKVRKLTKTKTHISGDCGCSKTVQSSSI
jgi:hypothetical protein